MTTSDRTVVRHEIRLAAAAVLLGVALLAIKFTAYILTGSAAIYSDALESIVNVLASGFALYAISLAHSPADRKHPYGHGKVEFLAAGFEGGMIALAALVIVFRAVQTMYYGPQIERLDHGLLLIFIALLINGGMGVALIRSGRRHGSITLQADGHHLLSDALTSVGVLIALLVVRFTGWAWADPIAALGVAAYITWIAAGLLRTSAAGLMDQQDLADDRLIREILDGHVGPAAREPRICSYHKLRHRHSGRYHWVDFHIMVPHDWSIEQGHRVASSIEYEIEQALGEANATAHVEPCENAECATCAQRQ
jgi:cation diffusion facilitator family transporter